MTSVVDIWNSALDGVGTRTSISAQTEDSAEARACRRNYELVLKQAHRAAQWGFCRKFDNLALLAAMPGTPENQSAWDGVWTPNLPPPPWLYTYAYPADCLQMRHIVQMVTTGLLSTPIMTGVQTYVPFTNRPARWAKGLYVQDGTQLISINTNQQNAIACYTVFVPDPNKWDDDFKQVVIDALSAQIAMTLVGSKELELQKIKDANNTILLARIRDGDEGMTINDITPDWVRIRGGWAVELSNYTEYYGAEYGPLFS